ncbi:Zinc finger protein 40 [Fasciolopsis buskii]|uniref:Zinc finger protein 40 n=1 Tax=Fasciolopsis buskii TaxID=27845 RepID=A0A8E0RQW3_9TREM|nr:Zinc finger protein 40 [Fasciolopsis buski]
MFQVCGERFSTRASWNIHHLKHRRPEDKLYCCTLCSGTQERTYENFRQLCRHMRQVHTNQIFPCPYCNWTFGRRKNLVNHLVRHTGRRDFVCPQDGCHKAYSRKDKLKTHMRIHISALL